jgi:hypothetical protein
MESPEVQPIGKTEACDLAESCNLADVWCNSSLLLVKESLWNEIGSSFPKPHFGLSRDINDRQSRTFQSPFHFDDVLITIQFLQGSLPKKRERIVPSGSLINLLGSEVVRRTEA